MNKKILLLLLAFTLSIVLGTYCWLNPSKEIPITHAIQNVKVVANNLQKLDAVHTSKFEKLQANNAFLIRKIGQTKTQVQSAKNHVAHLRNEVQQLNDKQVLQTQIDTTEYVIRCDSLQNVLDDFMSATTFKDSLVDEQVLQYEDLITTKDSTISCLENDYSALKINCGTLLKLQTDLANENKQILKKYVRIKHANQFIKGSLFVVAGLITATQIYSAN